LARLNAGNSIAASKAMMAITTNSSMSVNAQFRLSPLWAGVFSRPVVEEAQGVLFLSGLERKPWAVVQALAITLPINPQVTLAQICPPLSTALP
jgi:hypothetical protein